MSDSTISASAGAAVRGPRPIDVALLASVFVVAACGLLYELAAGALASYLLGDSVLQFSTIIGTYLFAMGVGSWLSRYFERQLPAHFLRIELLVALIGGALPAALFVANAYTPGAFRFLLYGMVLLVGTLVGLGRSDKLLQLQLLLNGLNLLLNVLLAMGLGWGVFGIGVGTALAEWLTVVCGLWLLHQLLGGAGQAWRWRWRSLGGWSSMRPMLLANVDILIRTLALLACFAWFTHQGALFGDTVLAANHILLQLISFAAFFLDGFAFAAEGWVGRAVGARQRQLFDAVLWRTSELALWTALALALLAWFCGHWAVALLTDLPSVRAQAGLHLLAVASYVLLSVAAFQLDGVFIGAGWTRAMRWASLLSAAAFGACWWLLQPWDNAGLWWAFVLYVLCRALALWLWLPGLRREIAMPASR